MTELQGATPDPATPVLAQYAEALRLVAPAESIELLAAILSVEDPGHPDEILGRLLKDAV